MDKINPQSARDPWKDLVLSILAVRKYSLEKTASKTEALREVGLLTPENLMGWGIEEIALQLRRAGLDRGEWLTNLFAKRLAALGNKIKAVGVNKFEGVIQSNDKVAIKNLLLPVNGIGPTVLANLFHLRGINGGREWDYE